MREARITDSRTPSRSSLPFSEIRCAGRYVAACLTTTIRSQGFSPSQRFDPRTSSRLYFTPHPLVGFRPSELFPPEPAVTPLDAQCSHAIRHTPSSTASGCGNTTRQPTIRAQALTSELCSGLASDTPHTRGLAREAAALLAFFLSKACQSVDRPETSPPLMHLVTDQHRGCPQASTCALYYRVLSQRTWALLPKKQNQPS
jgi:hypothetical protein